MRARKFITLVALVMAGQLHSLASQAAETAAGSADTWSVKITPYLWATRMHGSTQIKQLPEARIDMSFSDILDNLETLRLVDQAYLAAAVTGSEPNSRGPAR